MKILEIKNKFFPKIKPVKEIMNIKIPDIIDGVPNRNGFVFLMTGSGGSGKTNVLLNFFKEKNLYRYKFDNIFYFCPASSFSSVENHPFKDHEDVCHDLTMKHLKELESKLTAIKLETEGTEYNCIILDDMSNTLKDNDITKGLNDMIIKARHLQTCFIITTQSYFLCPKILRKQLTNLCIFKPKNIKEWASINEEMINMDKEDLVKLYNYVFDSPYQHLDIDTVECKYYKNFNLLQFET